MMIHEKLIPGQFLLDLKNDRSSLLNGHHHNPHNLGELHPQTQQHSGLTAHYLNHHHHHQSMQFQSQPPSPPMSTIKMDIYAAYAYQQQQKQQQQQLINNNNEKHNYNKAGALDLSRRCDSVETPRKTPSPGQTNSSIGTASPAASPPNSTVQQAPQQSMIPTNLLYSAQAQQQQNLSLPNGNLSAGLASLYPALYYSNGLIKSEPLCTSSPSCTPPLPPSAPQLLNTPTLPTAVNSSSSHLPIAAASDLLQTFANAAAVAAKTTPTTSNSLLPVDPVCKSPNSNATLATPTSPHVSSRTTLDVKNTRPFKAFPRDPLVIAANFAATDVLLDNPRVERYTEYRKRVLEQIRNSNGGTRTVTNPKMRRTNSRNADHSDSACRSSSEERPEDNNKADCNINVTSIDDSSDCDSNMGSLAEQPMTTATDSQTGKISSNGTVKDAAYYERRRKNNAAAKKSRDRRRIKEDEIAIRAAYLERQNIELLCQVDSLKAHERQNFELRCQIDSLKAHIVELESKIAA